MRFIIFSKGLHATWLLDKDQRNLFDIGEGCSTMLGYNVFAVERIFLSHSHMDHIAGLPCFIGLRNSTKGANEKPLAIFYPHGNHRIEEWIRFSLKMNGKLKYPLTFQPVKPGEKVLIFQGPQEKRYVEAFPVQHAREDCFGYRLVSITQGLKADYQGKGREYYASLTPQEKSAIMEDRLANKMVFSGDGMPLSTEAHSPLRKAEVAFLDSTFLSPKDREGSTHGSLEELAQVCRSNQVRTGYAMHLSIRYSKAEVQKKLSDLVPIFPLRLIPHDQVNYLN